ncbi:MAG: hypothetical protein IKZ82_06310 [Clostridia bacterium]|nr:hypothetical protein [Clostridia bacterium]
MKRDETEKLKKFLAAVYPRLYREISEEAVLGWYLVLKPYSYDEVREAILAYTRTSVFTPEPGDIANFIEGQRKAQAEHDDTEETVMSDDMRESVLRMHLYREKLREYYHSHGVPTFREYIDKHPSDPIYSVAWKTWDELCRKAGAGDPPPLKSRTTAG